MTNLTLNTIRNHWCTLESIWDIVSAKLLRNNMILIQTSKVKSFFLQEDIVMNGYQLHQLPSKRPTTFTSTLPKSRARHLQDSCQNQSSRNTYSNLPHVLLPFSELISQEKCWSQPTLIWLLNSQIHHSKFLLPLSSSQHSVCLRSCWPWHRIGFIF